MQQNRDLNNFATRYSLRPNFFQTRIFISAKNVLPQTKNIADFISYIKADDYKFIITESAVTINPEYSAIFQDCQHAYYTNELQCDIDNKFQVRKLKTSFFDTPIWCIYKLSHTTMSLYTPTDSRQETEIYTVGIVKYILLIDFDIIKLFILQTGIPYRITEHKQNFYDLNNYNHTNNFPQITVVIPNFDLSPSTDYFVYNDNVYCELAFTTVKLDSRIFVII